MNYKNQDRITLKGVKYLASLSEETHAYTATVYFDGVALGTTKNAGHGGCDEFRLNDKAGATAHYRKMSDFISSLDPENIGGGNDIHLTSPDLDWICSELVNQWLTLDDMKKATRRRVLFVRDGKLMQTACARNADQRTRWAKGLELDNSVSHVLNMMPIPEALAAWVKYG